MSTSDSGGMGGRVRWPLALLGAAALGFLGGRHFDSAHHQRANEPVNEAMRHRRMLSPSEGLDLQEWSTADEDDDASKNSELVEKTEQDKPVEKIILLGERHSGTNWITDHLADCFGGDLKVTNEYKRFKHWFQEEDLDKVPENSAVVVAMFRDPYDWVEAMRVEPHHAHDHIHYHRKCAPGEGWKECAVPIKWKGFVTKPWIGRRGRHDYNLTQTPGGIDHARCLDRYSYADAAPCSLEDSHILQNLGEYKYEFIHDGSERGYPSIVDLRRDKILNHLSVADFAGTRAFFPIRFEDMNNHGTASLLKSVEEATGFQAKCNATMGKAHRHLLPKAIIKHGELPQDFIQWMNKFADWEVEGRIGYTKRGE